MKPASLIIDTNLLLLFVVGSASRDYIEIHKRLTQFVPEDFDYLRKVVAKASAVRVTPNTLTETSNLAAHIAEPARSRVFETLRAIIVHCQERYVVSKQASARDEFIRLGLTDAALLETCDAEAELWTTDLNLYLAAVARGAKATKFQPYSRSLVLRLKLRTRLQYSN